MQSRPTSDRAKGSRERLVEAAIHCVAEHGIEGATVTAIVKKAGVSRGLLSYQFGGKQALLVAAFQALADDYRRELLIGPRPEISTDATPEQLLPTIIRRAVGGPGKLDDRAWLGFWSRTRTDADLQRLNRDVFDEVAAYLGDIIGRIARDRGVTVDTERAGRSLAVLIEGAWLHLTVGTLGFTLDEAVDLCERHAWSLVADATAQPARPAIEPAAPAGRPALQRERLGRRPPARRRALD